MNSVNAIVQLGDTEVIPNNNNVHLGRFAMM